MTLSRYSKIMGEVSDSEAADMIAKKLLKHGVSVPFNTVTPSLREELVERGVQITEPEKKTGKECAEGYEAWKANGGLRFSFSPNTDVFDKTRDRAIREKGIVVPGLENMEVEIVPVGEHGFKGSKPISQAKEWAKINLATPKDKSGNYIDRPKLIDGTPYIITANAIKKFLSDSAVKKTGDVRLHLSVLKRLKDIINKSIEGEIHASYIKDEYAEKRPENGLIEGQLVHRIFGAASFGGKVYVVKTTVIEERGGENRAYTYEVTDAEIELAATDATTKAEPMGLPHIGTANLLQGIEKSYDPGKKLLDNNGKSE